MKTINIYNSVLRNAFRTISGMFLLVAFALTSCNSFDPVPKNSLTENDVGPKTHTILEFLNDYMTDAGAYFPVRTRANGDYGRNLFSVDSIPAGGEDIIIRGRVISDDFAGNMYKTMVIQDSENPKQGFKIAVDAGSLSGLYPIGQMVNIRCNGLAVGKYANQAQLCVPAYNNNQLAMNWEQKVGWAPGRIPLPRFTKAITAIGLAEPNKIVVDTMTIAQIQALPINEVCGRLVYIKDIFFNGKSQGTTSLTDGNPETDSNAAVFAPTTNNIGFTQSRDIQDASGDYICIATSEYAKFARYKIPSSEYTGGVLGIVGYYFDNAKYVTNASNWSITIRSLDDLFLINDEGQEWVPEEWQ